MNEQLFKNLREDAHVARIMGIKQSALLIKKRAIADGKSPIIKKGKQPPELFEPSYIAAQKKFYRQLAEIAEAKLKEFKAIE